MSSAMLHFMGKGHSSTEGHLHEEDPPGFNPKHLHLKGSQVEGNVERLQLLPC